MAQALNESDPCTELRVASSEDNTALPAPPKLDSSPPLDNPPLPERALDTVGQWQMMLRQVRARGVMTGERCFFTARGGWDEAAKKADSECQIYVLCKRVRSCYSKA
jgi:hypothetical protein